MKKTATISTLAFGIAFLFSTTTQAMNPMLFSNFMMKAQAEISVEKEITVQDWMISSNAFTGESATSTEKNVKLENWMIENNWNDESSRIVSETEIELEDWMLKAFDTDNSMIALEDWMTRITG